MDADLIKSRIARGTLWSSTGIGLSLLLRFGSNVALTRLVHQEAFGLMALVYAFITGLNLFSDIGVGPSIIQSKRGENPNFINTAFTLQALRGLALWLVTVVCAVPFARFYNEPLLAWMLPVIGLAAVIEGLSSTKPITANRNLAMGRLTLVDLASQIVGLTVMLTWAYLSPSVWALVGGSITISGVRTILNHFAPGPFNRFHFDKDVARELLRFGRWIFVSTILTFLAGQADRLIFGKLVVNMEQLGVFAIAVNLATLPSNGINTLLTKIAFPLFSHLHNMGSDLRDAFRRTRWKFCVLGGWITAGLLGGGPTIIHLIYDDRYRAAGWMLQILAVAGWWSTIENTNGAALLARGHAQWVAAGSIAKLAGMVIFIPLGYYLGSFAGALIGASGSEFFRYLVSTYAIRKEKLHAFDQDFTLTLFVAGSATAGYMAARLSQLAGFNVIIESIAVFAATSVIWLPLVLPFLRRKNTSRTKTAIGAG